MYTYEQAVQKAIQTRKLFYGLSYRKNSDVVIGADIYVIDPNEEYCNVADTESEHPDDIDDNEFYVNYVGGLYGEEPETDFLSPDWVPKEVNMLVFWETDIPYNCLDYELEIVIDTLKGMPLEDAIKKHGTSRQCGINIETHSV
jgi:hypothetical protein